MFIGHCPKIHPKIISDLFVALVKMDVISQSHFLCNPSMPKQTVSVLPNPPEFLPFKRFSSLTKLPCPHMHTMHAVRTRTPSIGRFQDRCPLVTTGRLEVGFDQEASWGRGATPCCNLRLQVILSRLF